MVANKHISKIIIALMAVAVVLCILAIGFSDKLTEMLGGTGITMEYETELFDTDTPMTVNIEMDEDDWNTMLSNATSEEYYVCNVVINGNRVNNVAIRPKGNTSLSAIAMDPDTDRYSLKLEFDHYVDGQTCCGLDKLILNNNYADATNMKEALIYDMYQYLGVDASLYNYAEIYVNGEYWGVYLALEAVEDSFMLRNYGTQDGELYKPETLGMGGGDDSDSNNAGGKMAMPDMSNMDFSNIDMSNIDTSNIDTSNFDPSNMDFSNMDFSNMTPPSGGGGDSNTGEGDSNKGGGGSNTGEGDSNKGGGGFNFGDGGFNFGGGGSTGSSNGGADLNYSDDDLDSYSTIWDGQVTDTSKSDRRKVVTALKNISEGTNLEKYLDVDNVLKYMAVHTFSVNMDSLSGSMSHNYYLYGYDGQLNILPWDYNLSFGGLAMGASGGASDMINDAIDTPFSGTHFFDALLENEEYLARYHEYLRQLVDEYVKGGAFDENYNRIRSQIDSLVETDPTAFYTYDEYLTAADMIYETFQLRGESIKGQLDGSIPSTDSGQRQDSSNLVDASSIDIDAMGTFSMGGFTGGGFGDFSDTSSENSEAEGAGATEAPETQAGTETDASTENSEAGPDAVSQASGEFEMSNLPEGFDTSNLPEGFDASNMPQGMGGGNMPQGMDMSNLPEGFDASNMPQGMGGGNMPQGIGGNVPESGTTQDGMSMPANMSNMPGMSNGMSKIKNIISFAICFVVMLLALLFVKIYKRK